MPRGVPKNGFRMTKNKIAAMVADAPESRFTINQRFGFVSDMVNMLAKGERSEEHTSELQSH